MTVYANDPQRAALALWRHVFGDERGLLAVTHKKNGQWKEKFFAYPSAAAPAASFAVEKSSQGHDVYFCCHLVEKPSRVKENATAVSTLWGDVDGAPIPDGKLPPTAVVETSKGKYHVYLRLADAIPPETAELLNKRLALAIGADPSGFDLSQVLRVPGTFNLKPEYDGPQPVTLKRLDLERVYTAGDLDRMLPPLPSEATDGHDDDHAGDENLDEPPVYLAPAALRIWRGEKPLLREDGSGVDRSRSLFRIGRVLYDAGLTRPTLVAALRERDETLGWHCYTRRRDGDKQYANLVTALEKKPRKAQERASDRPNSHSHSLHGNGNGNFRWEESQNGATRHPSDGLRAVSFSGREEPPPQEFVVENLIPSGLSTAFFGAGGLAKSVNVLHLSLAVAFQGVEYWNQLKVSTCPVILLDFEMSEAVQLRRAKHIARGAGWPDVPKGFRYVEGIGHPPAKVFGFASELVREHGPSLVVVDSFGYSLEGESETSSDVLGYVRNNVQPLQDLGATILIVDHIARPIKGERAQDKEQFGSVYKGNSMRSTVHMSGHADEHKAQVYATFTHRKSNLGPKMDPFTVVVDFRADAITFERSDVVIHPPTEETVEQDVVNALREAEPLTNGEIADHTGRDLKSVQNATGGLKRVGKIRETGEKRGREMLLERAD